MVMEEMQARSKLPLRLTYRSVGSSIGLTEFINDFDLQKSAFDFGSSEIPVATEDWQKFKDENVTILQLPGTSVDAFLCRSKKPRFFPLPLTHNPSLFLIYDSLIWCRVLLSLHSRNSQFEFDVLFVGAHFYTRH